MTVIRQMFELQAVDVEIDHRNERLTEIAKRLGNERQLAKYRTEAAAAIEAADRISAEQRALETVASELTGRIDTAEARLYGGTVSNPRELRDLEADIAQLKRQRGDREGELLVVMDELETAQTRRDAATKLLAKAERVWKADQAHMASEKSQLQSDLTTLFQDRRTKAEGLKPIDISLYEQVRKGHGGIAVAEMRNGTCLSCRVALPTRQASTIKTSVTPIRCPSCGLILLPD